MTSQEELKQLKKKIRKEIEHLKSLKDRLDRLESKAKKTSSESEEARIRKLERELKRKFPSIEVDRELLSLVGTLPEISVEREKQLIAQIVAQRHGK